MFNVDTLSLVLNFRKYIKVIDINKHLDLKKITPVNEKILSRLYVKREVSSSGIPVVKITGNYDGYFFYYNYEWNSLTVTLPHYKVDDFKANEIIDNAKNAVMEYFNLSEDEMVPIQLSRIDIKCDYLCKDDDIIIIKNIISKIKNSFRYYQKRVQMDNEQGYVVKYSSHIKKNYVEYNVDRYTFKTYKISKSSLLVSKNNNRCNKHNERKRGLDKAEKENYETGCNIEFSFYDKGKETKYRVSVGKANKSEIEKYNNIFRTEIRIKNGRLNSNVFENKTMKKDLRTYYNPVITSELYHKYIKSVLGENDFYRIDKAIDIIINSNYRNSKKEKLVAFIVDINKYGYSKAEDAFLEHKSKTTWYSYIHSIEKLGINVITFDTIIDGKTISTEKLDNFGQLKNDVSNQSI